MGNKDNTLFYCLAVIVLFIIIVVMKGKIPKDNSKEEENKENKENEDLEKQKEEDKKNSIQFSGGGDDLINNAQDKGYTV